MHALPAQSPGAARARIQSDPLVPVLPGLPGTPVREAMLFYVVRQDHAASGDGGGGSGASLRTQLRCCGVTELLSVCPELPLESFRLEWSSALPWFRFPFLSSEQANL